MWMFVGLRWVWSLSPDRRFAAAEKVGAPRVTWAGEKVRHSAVSVAFRRPAPLQHRPGIYIRESEPYYAPGYVPRNF